LIRIPDIVWRIPTDSAMCGDQPICCIASDSAYYRDMTGNGEKLDGRPMKVFIVSNNPIWIGAES
jgi:hypothetical protein